MLYLAAKAVTSFLKKMARLHFVTNTHDCLFFFASRNDDFPRAIAMNLHDLFQHPLFLQKVIVKSFAFLVNYVVLYCF